MWTDIREPPPPSIIPAPKKCLSPAVNDSTADVPIAIWIGSVQVSHRRLDYIVFINQSRHLPDHPFGSFETGNFLFPERQM